MNILVVEDEAPIRELITLNLQMEGYKVFAAPSAEEGLKLLEQNPDMHLAILDVMLPGMNGFSLCENIRRRSADMGIIILSAKSMEEDKIRGLSIGADDYMAKPFGVSELMARVSALSRRVGRTLEPTTPAAEDDGRIVCGEFALDGKNRALYHGDKLIELTQVEFQIMELFFHNLGEALPREKILEGVWGSHYYGDVKIVDVNIRRLRMKIEQDAGNPQHLMTVWGYGYRWNI